MKALPASASTAAALKLSCTGFTGSLEELPVRAKVRFVQKPLLLESWPSQAGLAGYVRGAGGTVPLPVGLGMPHLSLLVGQAMKGVPPGPHTAAGTRAEPHCAPLSMAPDVWRRRHTGTCNQDEPWDEPRQNHL